MMEKLTEKEREELYARLERNEKYWNGISLTIYLSIIQFIFYWGGFFGLLPNIHALLQQTIPFPILNEILGLGLVWGVPFGTILLVQYILDTKTKLLIPTIEDYKIAIAVVLSYLIAGWIGGVIFFGFWY